MTPEMEHRIQQLEELSAHQARTIEELSSQLTEQWKAHDQLKARFERLTERFLTLEEEVAPAPENTRPPHW